ncbi:MAG: hypothetical protein ABIQ95_02160 [Bdellovibrionia bacterium]
MTQSNPREYLKSFYHAQRVNSSRDKLIICENGNRAVIANIRSVPQGGIVFNNRIGRGRPIIDPLPLIV